MSPYQDDSPNLLDTSRRRGEGVRRLNRVPLLIAALMLVLVAGAVVYTYQMRLAEMRRRAAESGPRAEPADITRLFPEAPSAGPIDVNPPPAEPPVFALPAEPAPQAKPKAAPKEGPAQKDEAWEAYRAEQARLAQLRAQRLREAIASTTEVAMASQARPQPPDPNEEHQSRTGTDGAGVLAAQLVAGAARQQLAGEEDTTDINRAAEKRAFLNDHVPKGRSEHYLSSGREAALSPYEVKAGTVIPAIMVGGVSSDLPGQIVGQVSANVYDSATGRHLLIPQGAKLIGAYDNAVTPGQDRVLVAWTRIIYPDSSSIDLGKMPGADASGFAGFHDRVDTHFWEMFGHALLLSVFSAGVQITQGGQNSGANGLNAQQTIAAGLGQQLGQLGQELARRNAQIQPTLEIRPGYRFTVMVTKDMMIRPWRHMREGLLHDQTRQGL